MASYRILLLDRAGRVVGFHDFGSETDDAALLAASCLVGPHPAFEVWKGATRVAGTQAPRRPGPAEGNYWKGK